MKATEVAEARPCQQLEALLRSAHQLAPRGETDELFVTLLEEARKVIGGDAAVIYRCDDSRSMFVPLRHSFSGEVKVPESLPFGQGVVGQAVVERRPVVVNDYQHAPNVIPAVARLGFEAVIAAPLLYEDRCLGFLGVGTLDPAKRFDETDARTIEVLAGLAAAEIVGLERARLAGVQLLARTAEDTLNNQLAIVCGFAELILADAMLPAHLQPLASEACTAALRAAGTIKQFRQITQINEKCWGGGLAATIDLASSIA